MKKLMVCVGIGTTVCAICLFTWWKNFDNTGSTPAHVFPPLAEIPRDTYGRYVPPKATETQRCISKDGLPDLACTPSAVNPLVTQGNLNETICKKGYTKTIRPAVSYTNNLKRQQMRAYGFEGSLSDYEEDHQIALELGGDPISPANLWPQKLRPWPGALDKDHVENYLRHEVCAGAMTLAQAQYAIATDWRAIYTSVPNITKY